MDVRPVPDVHVDVNKKVSDVGDICNVDNVGVVNGNENLKEDDVILIENGHGADCAGIKARSNGIDVNGSKDDVVENGVEAKCVGVDVTGCSENSVNHCKTVDRDFNDNTDSEFDKNAVDDIVSNSAPASNTDHKRPSDTEDKTPIKRKTAIPTKLEFSTKKRNYTPTSTPSPTSSEQKTISEQIKTPAVDVACMPSSPDKDGGSSVDPTPSPKRRSSKSKLPKIDGSVESLKSERPTTFQSGSIVTPMKTQVELKGILKRKSSNSKQPCPTPPDGPGSPDIPEGRDINTSTPVQVPGGSTRTGRNGVPGLAALKLSPLVPLSDASASLTSRADPSTPITSTTTPGTPTAGQGTPTAGIGTPTAGLGTHTAGLGTPTRTTIPVNHTADLGTHSGTHGTPTATYGTPTTANGNRTGIPLTQIATIGTHTYTNTADIGTPTGTPTTPASTTVLREDIPDPMTPTASTLGDSERGSLPSTLAVCISTPRSRKILEEEEWQKKIKQFQVFKMAMTEVSDHDPRSRFLRCLFCTNLFTLSNREPRMLVCCLNAICSACATKLHPESHTFLHCPVCRQSISIPGSDRTSESIDLIDESFVSSDSVELPAEILRVKLLEYQHIQKGLTFPCTLCTRKSLCTWLCENCDSYMCDQCRDAHKEDLKSKRHSTVALPSLKSRQLRNFKQNHYCKEHNFSKLTLFCTTCKQVVCNMCLRDGHDKETHEVITIQEAFGSRIKQTGKLLTKARKKHRNLSAYSRCLQLKNECNDVSMCAARDAINDTFDQLMDVLQHRRSELLAQLGREASTLSTSSTMDTDSTDYRLSMLSTATDYATEFKSKADNVEFLQLFSMVSESLKNAMDAPNNQAKTSRQGVVFSSWNLDLVETVLKTAGQVKVVTFKPTGRPGREEVQVRPAVHPEGHDLDTLTTLGESSTEHTIPRDLVCSVDDRVILIPETSYRPSVVIMCPKLKFDLLTLHPDRTVTTEGAMINHAPERPLANTGCRLRSYPGAMADRALDDTGFKLWIVKAKVHIKQRVPDNKMLIEIALTGTPVDAPLSQRIDTSLVLAGCDLHHDLCVKVKYCCKSLAHFSGCKNAPGSNAEFNYGMLLDFDRRRLHVIDLSNNTVISKTDKINVHKPLWPMFCVGRFTFADVILRIVSCDKVKVTPGLFQLLTKIVDKERAK